MRACCLPWSMVMASAALALANQPDPSNESFEVEPRPDPQAIQYVLREDRLEPLPIAPAGGADPAGDAVPGGTMQHRLWPEDFVLAQRQGVLRFSDDAWYLVFSDTEDPEEPGRIRILPNSKLKQMEAYVASSDRDVQFAVSGQITEYGDHNFLLIREVTILGAPAVTADEPSQAEVASSPAGGAQSILDRLDREVRSAQPLEALEDAPAEPTVVTASSVAPAEPSRLLPEGTRVDHRVGRLIRDPEGWVLAFESRSERPADPPLRLLPNLALRSMEGYSRRGLQRVVFNVSGLVTAYGGQNYLLVRRFTLQPDDGNLN